MNLVRAMDRKDMTVSPKGAPRIFGFSERMLRLPIQRLRKWLLSDTDAVLWMKTILGTMDVTDRSFDMEFVRADWASLNQHSLIADAAKIAGIIKKLM